MRAPNLNSDHQHGVKQATATRPQLPELYSTGVLFKCSNEMRAPALRTTPHHRLKNGNKFTNK